MIPQDTLWVIGQIFGEPDLRLVEQLVDRWSILDRQQFAVCLDEITQSMSGIDQSRLGQEIGRKENMSPSVKQYYTRDATIQQFMNRFATDKLAFMNGQIPPDDLTGRSPQTTRENGDIDSSTVAAPSKPRNVIVWWVQPRGVH